MNQVSSLKSDIAGKEKSLQEAKVSAESSTKKLSAVETEKKTLEGKVTTQDQLVEQLKGKVKDLEGKLKAS